MTGSPGESDDRVIDGGIRWSVFVLSTLLVIYLSVSGLNRPNRATQADLVQLPTYPPRKTPRPRPVLPRIQLVDVTLEAGIDFVHDRGSLGEWKLPEAMGGGCVVFDFDLDGDQDVLLIHSSLRNQGSSLALYSNDGSGSFRNVTEQAGLSVSLIGMGGTAADFDNDGWPDLFITTIGANRLFHNRGGEFQEVTASSGVAGDESVWSMGSCWIDYDQDGDLDLFICNYLDWSADLDRRLNCCWNGIDRSYCDPDLFAGTQPYFYKNQGDGSFEDISAAVGVVVKNRDTGQPVPKALAVVACDLNGDGRPDLAVTGDGGRNLAYVNIGATGFQEMGTELGFAFDRYGQAARSFGIDSADLSGDETIALGIGRAGNVAKSLFIKSKGDTVLTDRNLTTGVGPPTRQFLTFGFCFLDIDLDGRLDILMSNGQIQETFETLQTSQTWRQSPQLLWQSTSSPLEFWPLTREECGEDFFVPVSGRGCAYADFDQDGDLDLLITTVGGNPRLLRNDLRLNHSWLRLNLHARTANRDALQTRVEATMGSLQVIRCVQPVGGYLSQHESQVLLGLGTATSVDMLMIQWPDGTQEEFPNVSTNQTLDIVQANREAQ